jgi:Rrf2 family protein
MNLNRITKHGIRALLVLARGGSFSSVDLETELQVSRPVIQKAMQALVRAGLVNSQRGTGGGFKLAKPPSRITLYDAVNALQGFTPEKPPWYKIMALVMQALDGVSLAEMGKW